MVRRPKKDMVFFFTKITPDKATKATKNAMSHREVRKGSNRIIQNMIDKGLERDILIISGELDDGEHNPRA